MAKKEGRTQHWSNGESGLSFSLPISATEWDFLARYFSAPMHPHEARAFLYHLIGLVETTSVTLLAEEAISGPFIRLTAEVQDVA